MNLFKACGIFLILAGALFGQDANPKKVKKTQPPFRWVNPLSAKLKLPGVKHATFTSPSMNVPAGYCIYLPPTYAKQIEPRRSAWPAWAPFPTGRRWSLPGAGRVNRHGVWPAFALLEWW
jgi:hypothetical protein